MECGDWRTEFFIALGKLLGQVNFWIVEGDSRLELSYSLIPFWNCVEPNSILKTNSRLIKWGLPKSLVDVRSHQGSLVLGQENVPCCYRCVWPFFATKERKL